MPNIPSYENGRMYNNPPQQPGSFPQLIPFYWYRKALIDLVKERYFGQLADTMSMPKHMGKTIRRFHYIPMLDDRNINDQGIDATGQSIADEVTITITDPAGMSRYAVGKGADAVTAQTVAEAEAVDIMTNLGLTFANFAALQTALLAAGWSVTIGQAVNGGGNLYGSSKDVGTIVGQLPVISETGGRVNRVGFTRITMEAGIENFGFFEEYTEDSVQFDNDSQLMEHISRETLRGANELTEDMLQIDLLNAANVGYSGGNATATNELTGDTGATPSVLDYNTLVNLEIILNDNRCPKDTKIISGSRMEDTKTIPACRYAYIGSELEKTLLKMKDYHNEKAFIPVQHYAQAGHLAAGEIGSVGHFRFIEVPEMMHWDGVGAAVTNNAGYMEHNGYYNAYPMLVVGSGSFTTIGFQTSGAENKFKIYHRAPGAQMANRDDPYGKMGFYSIQFWYGFMVIRPEWIALVKVVAER